jgi:two-component system sensor histidine kinase KdpD
MDINVFPNKIKIGYQYLVSLIMVCIAAGIGYLLSDLLGYRAVALLLLVTVSILAMLFDIFPVLLAAVVSALIWDYFFIPPRFTLTIGSGEDSLLLIMYFLIALVNAVLTFKIRRIEKQALEKKEKEKTIKLYNTILNSLSHELRTPISTIIGATDILKESNPNISEENRKVLVTEISEASLRLNQQVENLLNMSRLESGVIQTKLHWIDINELLHSVVKKCKEESDGHIIHIHTDDMIPPVILDGGLMQQALYNLVHNSILYTPKGSNIVLNAHFRDHELTIEISDNGPGFPEDEIPKVFDKFYRLYNTQPGGTGLGLSIVKGVVEAHHGKITLTNQKKGGALFTICLPAKTAYLTDLGDE